MSQAPATQVRGDFRKIIWLLLLRLTRMAWVMPRFCVEFLLAALAGFVGRRSEGEVRDAQARALTALLEQVGGAFIKFGQILAMRPDFLPREYISALSKLLDDIEPFPTTVAKETLESELGKGVGEIFSEFQEKPLASASFGQVYKARLKSGEWVAVKVRRPEIHDVVKVDLGILKLVAKFLDFSATLPQERLFLLYEEFARWTTEELDYRVEARNAETLRSASEQNSIEVIPKVYWNLTTQRILTLEYLDGISLKSILEGREDVRQRCVEDGISLEEVAKNLLRVLLREAFEYGRFHADPHAGNIFVLPQNRIGLVDFGIVGFLGTSLRRHLLVLLKEIGRGNADAAFWASVRILDPPEYVDLLRYRHDYHANLERWMDVASDPRASLEERSSARLILDSMEISRRHGIGVQTAVVLYYRALVMVDIIALQIAPTLDVSAEAYEFLKELRRQSDVSEVTPDEAVLEYRDFFLELPRRLNELLTLQIEMRARDYRRTGRRRLARLIGGLANLTVIGALLAFAVGIAGGRVLVAVGVESMPWTLLAGYGLALAFVLKRLARSVGRR
ncbi:MAG TPA: AarF/UbiB family protein, partial [Candidatus Binatia bacterium]|nr:AarF/UbiB family protein [Candidatus Binatia bacterium]